MSGALNERAAELQVKLAALRAALDESGAGAIRLRGTDWFAWATAGGSNTVLMAAETGVAEVLVSRDEACILTDEIEAGRLRDEEIPPGFTYHVAPWAELELRERYVLEVADGRPLLSDRPANEEQPLPASLRQRKMVLGADEVQRYRALGRAAAEAMTEVLNAARPDWTEYDLAGAGAQALWRRGIHPALVLTAGERRLPMYRHATPSDEPLGQRAMLVFCARRYGLYANLTRFVSFGPGSADQQDLLAVEATGLDAIQDGHSLSSVYFTFEQAYRHANRPDAIHEHHQGGITGYQAREIVATPLTATVLETGMAFAFNPSFKGVKVEDTFVLTPSGLENMTLDQHWPATTVQGRVRPLWLEKP
jgi:Xaa-Pro aminopeptidase